MTINEIMEHGVCPIMLYDGAVGLIIRWDTEREEVCVQVPGEADVRWIEAVCVLDIGYGTLIEAPF